MLWGRRRDARGDGSRKRAQPAAVHLSKSNFRVYTASDLPITMAAEQEGGHAALKTPIGQFLAPALPSPSYSAHMALVKN